MQLVSKGLFLLGHAGFYGTDASPTEEIVCVSLSLRNQFTQHYPVSLVQKSLRRHCHFSRKHTYGTYHLGIFNVTERSTFALNASQFVVETIERVLDIVLKTA